MHEKIFTEIIYWKIYLNSVTIDQFLSSNKYLRFSFVPIKNDFIKNRLEVFSELLISISVTNFGAVGLEYDACKKSWNKKSVK